MFHLHNTKLTSQKYLSREREYTKELLLPKKKIETELEVHQFSRYMALIYIPNNQQNHLSVKSVFYLSECLSITRLLFVAFDQPRSQRNYRLSTIN